MGTLNLNVGLLGHVDSGKTSLAKALSTIASTASFDKNPQSQERGITIDLGFSSFTVEPPSTLSQNVSLLQFTLVDCPGHASLIKTIIGGAHIIDFMLLVIDVTKGIQTQTAECFIIGEIMLKKLIIVLNKIDLIEEAKREVTIQKVKKVVRLRLKNTIYCDSEVVSVSAKSENGEPVNLNQLVDAMKHISFQPERNTQKPFLFAVDHCFGIKGKGTILTGTILQGEVKINDDVEIPSIKLVKKVKSIQMFKKPIESGKQGDRIGLCVLQFDPKLIERGIACSPSLVKFMYAVIINLNFIKYFRSAIKSKSKFHISIGYDTVIGKLLLFQSKSAQGNLTTFTFDTEYEYVAEISAADLEEKSNKIFSLIEFEKPTLVIPDSLVIGSKLDIDIHTNCCRLAFHGNVQSGFTDKNYATQELRKLKVYKEKCKRGIVERQVNETELICKNMFKKETNLDRFMNLKVKLATGEDGVIDGAFGQSGKIRIRILDGVKIETSEMLKKTKESQQKQVEVVLHHRKFIFDPDKKIMQN